MECPLQPVSSNPVRQQDAEIKWRPQTEFSACSPLSFDLWPTFRETGNDAAALGGLFTQVWHERETSKPADRLACSYITRFDLKQKINATFFGLKSWLTTDWRTDRRLHSHTHTHNPDARRCLYCNSQSCMLCSFCISFSLSSVINSSKYRKAGCNCEVLITAMFLDVAADSSYSLRSTSKQQTWQSIWEAASALKKVVKQ